MGINNERKIIMKNNKEHQETKTFYIKGFCEAIYEGKVEVPVEMTFEEALKYTKDNLDYIPVGNLEFIEELGLSEDLCSF